MAWAFIASRGTLDTSTSSTTFAMSPSAAIAVGRIAAVSVVTDNVQTTDGASTLHTSITDTDGHTWTKVLEWTRGAGAAGAGVTTSLWVTKVTSEIGTGDSVTITLASAQTVKILAIAEFSVGAGNTFQVADAQGGAGSATSMTATISGLSSAARLWLGVAGWETAVAITTQDPDYTQIVVNDIGSGATAVSVQMAYRLATLTGDTFAPAVTNARDYATILAALDEVSGSIAGALAETQADQTLAASGTVSAPSVIGTLAETQDAQTVAASGRVSIIGSLAETQANQTLAASGIAGNVYEVALISKGVTHYWPVDQVVGGEILDVIGGVDMTVRGSPTPTDGPTDVLSAALLFDGINDDADVVAPNYQGDGTVIIWVQTKALNQTTHDEAAWNTADTQRIGCGAFVQIDQAGTDFWEFHGADDSDVVYDLIGNAVVVDQWEFMACTIQASGARFYMVDGGVVTLKDSLTDGSITQVDWQVFRLANGRAANAFGHHVIRGPAAARSALTLADLQDIYDSAQSAAISGTLTETQADQTLSASGTVAAPVFTGTLAETQDAQSASASGTVTPPLFSGTLAETQEDQTVAASGTHSPPVFSGDLAETQDEQTVEADGIVTPPTFSGSLAETQDDQTLSATGAFSEGVSGSVNVIQDDQTAAAVGMVTPPLFTGALVATQDDQAATAAGMVTAPTFTGSLAAIQDDQTLEAAGTFTNPTISGTVDATQEDQVATAVGVLTMPWWTPNLVDYVPDAVPWTRAPVGYTPKT